MITLSRTHIFVLRHKSILMLKFVIASITTLTAGLFFAVSYPDTCYSVCHVHTGQLPALAVTVISA